MAVCNKWIANRDLKVEKHEDVLEIDLADAWEKTYTSDEWNGEFIMDLSLH